jgi:hypothetical protein
MYDETPDEDKLKKFDPAKIAVTSHAVFKDHLGHNVPIHTEQVNQSQLRLGYIIIV